MNNERCIAVLNNLIETSRDSLAGFKLCAEYALDPTLRMYFLDRAKGCAEAVRALSNEVREYDGVPSLNSAIKEASHRVWIELQASITSSDNIAALEECERAENLIITTYEEALNEDLPDTLRIIINLKLQALKDNLNYIRFLIAEEENNITKHKVHLRVA